MLPQCTERVWWGPESECRVVTRKYPAALQQTANISYTLHELLLHTFVSLYTSFVFCLAGIWNPTYSGKCVAHRVFDSRHPLLLLWQQIVLPHLPTRRTRWSGDTGSKHLDILMLHHSSQTF